MSKDLKNGNTGGRPYKKAKTQYYTELNSSNLVAMAYHPYTKKLYVDLKNGSTYKYEEISQEEIDRIMASDSKGSAYHKIIVVNYKGTKV